MGKVRKCGWIHSILLVITVIWGFNNIVLKVGFQYLSAPQFSGVRMVMTFPFMIYFAFWMPGRVRFTKRDFWGVVAIGCLGLGLFQVLFPIGIDQTSASLGGILMATMPIHVVILSLIFRLERPELKSIIGILLTVGGLIIIILASHQPDAATKTTLKGIVFIIVAEFGYAINTTFLRQFMQRYPPMQVTGLAMAVSVCIYLVVFFPDMRSLVPSEINPIVWLCAIYSGLISFLFANILWNYAIKYIGSTKVSVYGNMPPVIVAILSAILFHDVLNLVQMVGAVIILTGVVLVQLRETDSPEEGSKVQSVLVEKAYTKIND